MNNANNEEYVKEYITRMSKLIQDEVAEIVAMDWTDPYAFIRMGEVTQSLRATLNSTVFFKEYLNGIKIAKERTDIQSGE